MSRHVDAYGEKIRMYRLAEEASNPIPDARERAPEPSGARGADRWPDGTIVSHRDALDIVGRVIAVVSQKDGRRYTRVMVIESGSDWGGFRVGDSDWHNGRWVLGKGARQSRCQHCHQPFRDEHGRREYCELCDDVETVSRTRSVAMTNPKPPYDDTESPF